jgi:predicted Na+-dependent transporter
MKITQKKLKEYIKQSLVTTIFTVIIFAFLAAIGIGLSFNVLTATTITIKTVATLVGILLVAFVATILLANYFTAKLFKFKNDLVISLYYTLGFFGISIIVGLISSFFSLGILEISSVTVGIIYIFILNYLSYLFVDKLRRR